MPLGKPQVGDIVAGLSVALIAIPQSMAYAELAGLPAQYGLYASALPSLFAAYFMSSPYLQTGPVALTSLLTFGALSALAPVASPTYIGLAALLALLVGLIRVILGLVRLGSVAYLLSEPVMAGFTTGAAVLIVSSQLPKVFGVIPDEGGVVQNAWHALANPGRWEWSAVAFAVASVVIILVGRRIHTLFPGVLVAVVAAVVASTWLGYEGSVIGELDGGFITPFISFPWDSLKDLAVPALVIALVGFAEPSSIARTFAAQERQTWDANRELVSQGVANLASALSGGFPVGGSFSRSSLNKLAGAKSAWAGATTGAFILIALPLTPLLKMLPRSVLGAVVILAVFRLIKIGDLVRIARLTRWQGVVAFGTLAATIGFSPRVEYGVVIGIALAVGVHLFRELAISVRSEVDGEQLTIRPQGVLWFATVPKIESLVRQELAGNSDVNTVVIDLGAVGRLDFSGGAALHRVVDDFRRSGVTVRIESVPPGSELVVAAHLEPLESIDS